MRNWLRPWTPTPKANPGLVLTKRELHELIMRQLGPKLNKLDYTVRLSDKNYYLPHREDIKRIIRTNQINRRKWIAEKFDCDDFAMLLKAAVIEDQWRRGKRRYPTAFGLLYGTRLKEGHHAFNIVVTSDKRVQFIEPQNDEMFSPRTDDAGIYLVLM